jgi:hypothetical protein
MFKIVPDPTFTADAQITVPGQAEPARLRIEWRHKSRKELQAWLDQLADRETDEAAGLDLVIVGWEGVEDQNGETVPYSKERLRHILENYPAAGADFVRSYVRSLTESRLGN